MKRYLLIIICIALFCNAKSQELTFYSEEFETAFREALGLSETEAITNETAETVITLNLEGYGLEDIRDIEYFPNLEELNLSYNAIRNIMPVRHLKYLKNLNISSNYLETIDALALSESMEMLINVSGNYIKSFYAVANSWTCRFTVIGASFQQPTSYVSDFYTDYDFAESSPVANYNVSTIDLYSDFFVVSGNVRDTIEANRLTHQVKDGFPNGTAYVLANEIPIDSTCFISPQTIESNEDPILIIPSFPMDDYTVLSVESFQSSEISYEGNSISFKFSDGIVQDTVKVGFGRHIADGIDQLKGYTYY
ncbi:MAG: hypothetical protein LBM08_00115, partial [Dysgonamonadaceae bacterium]|nr:hypothetical protein [Dysgonamonadaceae bacterium]